MARFLTTLTITLLINLLASITQAYQEIEVTNGGTIKGRAVLTHERPQPRVFHLILFPNLDMCAEIDTDDELNRVLYDFIIDDKWGMKDVVISIEHVEAGKPFEEETIDIKAESCKFIPDVSVIRQGGSFTVDNVDAVMHNSQVYQSERGKIIINIPIPAEEISHGKVTFQKDFKIFQMICGMHEFMQSWGYRVQNPYNDISGGDGSYKIDNIPPGDYVVTAWHYLMKLRTKKIHIEPNSVIDLDFEFDGREVTRPLYETIRSGRIKKEAAAPGTAKRGHKDAEKKLNKKFD